MKTTLVDSNVLLDIATNDAAWFDWSSQALESVANESPLAINAIIYAEVSIGFQRIEDLESAIPVKPISPRSRCHSRQRFWQEKRSFNTGGAGAVVSALYPISTSARTPPWPAFVF